MFDLHPYTIVLSIAVTLVLQVIIQKVGKSAIQEKAWELYLAYIAPKISNSKVSELSAKKVQHKQLLKERNAISAQDHYAKWTKLNRKVDKMEAEIESFTGAISSERSRVTSMISWVIFIVNYIPIWFFRIFFRKSVLFYLPPGVFPHAIEWLVALPFMPLGGVGLMVFMWAARGVLDNLIFLLTFIFESAPPLPESKPQQAKVVELDD